MSKKIIRHAIQEALAAVIYVVLVVTWMNNAERLYERTNPIISGTAILLLLVFSAAMMGLTIFGRSIIWYLDGQKKEAVQLLFYKLGFILLVMIIVFLGLSIS